MKGTATSSSVRLTHHLPSVVDAIRNAATGSQGTKVSYTHPVRAGDESTEAHSSRGRKTCHLPGVVEAKSCGVNTAQIAKVHRYLAVEIDEI
jgi:hypothetical protein